MTIRLALAAALLCTSAGFAQMTFTTIGRGDTSQIEAPRTVAVRTAADWAKLWTEHGGDGKPPDVDFTRSMVIGVFLGTRPTAGYAAEIARLEQSDADLVVTYRERAPAPGQMVAQMLTSPFHLVRTDAHDGPVRFTRAR